MTSYSKHRYHVLDGMRGIAAIIVMLFHYYNQSYPQFMKNELLAVDFFFILSGFILYHSYGQKILEGLSIGQYLARRLSRLYPMAAIGLLIGLPAFYLQIMQQPGDFSRRDLISSMATNLALLPYITGKTQIIQQTGHIIEIFPDDTPLWSIFFEMFASVCFLFLVRLQARRLLIFCLSCFTVLVIGSYVHGFTDKKLLFDIDSGWTTENFLQGFPRALYAFSAGMVIYVWHTSGKAFSKTATADRLFNPWVLYAALVIILTFPSDLDGIYDILTVSLFAPMLIWFAAKSSSRGFLITKGSQFLGWISFPLYCLHYPVLEEVKLFNEKYHFALTFSVSPQLVAISLSMILSILIVASLDTLKVQSKMTSVLDRFFIILAR